MSDRLRAGGGDVASMRRDRRRWPWLPYVAAVIIITALVVSLTQVALRHRSPSADRRRGAAGGLGGDAVSGDGGTRRKNVSQSQRQTPDDHRRTSRTGAPFLLSLLLQLSILHI